MTSSEWAIYAPGRKQKGGPPGYAPNSPPGRPAKSLLPQHPDLIPNRRPHPAPLHRVEAGDRVESCRLGDRHLAPLGCVVRLVEDGLERPGTDLTPVGRHPAP